MSWLKAILEELVGLFVDDLAYAAAIVAIIVAAVIASHYVQPPAHFLGLGLFAALVITLVTSAILKGRSIARKTSVGR